MGATVYTGVHNFSNPAADMDFIFLLGPCLLQVHIRSPFILNGVCVRWKGYLDLERLDGVGCVEFDEDAATLEDAIMRDTVEAYNRRIKDFEEHQKARSRQLAAFMGHQQQVAAAIQVIIGNNFE